MIDALSESYQSFPAGRLRNALSEFSTTIYFNGSFDKSLEELNGKFDNGFIDSLCIILLQARESGQAMELLRDISQQITDMQASLQLKKKEKLNRITTFCLMGIMGAMIGVALYAAITQMYASIEVLTILCDVAGICEPPSVASVIGSDVQLASRSAVMSSNFLSIIIRVIF